MKIKKGISEEVAKILFLAFLMLIFFLFLLTDFRGGDVVRGEWGEKERNIGCSTYICIHGLIFACALNRDQPTTLMYWNNALTT